MLKLANTILVILLLFLLCLVSVHAKDITNEQRNAYQARQDYNQNKSDYESLLGKVAKQERYLVKQQQKLDQLNADKLRAKEKLDQSKQRLDAEVEVLNRAWDTRDQ